MIKKFTQYNESLRDKMTPKSYEEVIIGYKKHVEKLVQEYNDIDDLKNALEEFNDKSKIFKNNFELFTYLLYFIDMDVIKEGFLKSFNYQIDHNLTLKESLRDKMTAKSDEEILKTAAGRSPFAVISDIAYSMEWDESEVPQVILDQRENALKELDDIFEKYPYENYKRINLDNLSKEVSEWVEKYKGYDDNITDHGLIDFAKHLTEHAFDDGYDALPWFNKETVDLFKTLLKQVAIDSVTLTNSDMTIDY